MQKLQARRALVTGASAGIGAATARALAREGAELVLVGRRRERLEQLAAELPRARVIVLDVRDHARVLAELGTLEVDILINNAGLSIGTDKLFDGDPTEWKTAVDTNVLGVLNVTRALLPRMIAQKRGELVFLGSVAGRQVYPGGSVYCATKHAVHALYETARLETNGTGIRCLTVDPGMVGGTEFSGIRMRGDLDKAGAVYAGVDPLSAEDVADAIVWAITRPPRVNIGEIVMWASAQASTTLVARRPASS